MERVSWAENRTIKDLLPKPSSLWGQRHRRSCEFAFCLCLFSVWLLLKLSGCRRPLLCQLPETVLTSGIIRKLCEIELWVFLSPWLNHTLQWLLAAFFCVGLAEPVSHRNFSVALLAVCAAAAAVLSWQLCKLVNFLSLKLCVPWTSSYFIVLFYFLPHHPNSKTLNCFLQNLVVMCSFQGVLLCLSLSLARAFWHFPVTQCK